MVGYKHDRIDSRLSTDKRGPSALLHNPAMFRFVTPNSYFVWTGVVLAFVFAVSTAYGLSTKSARTQCVTEGKFCHNDRSTGAKDCADACRLVTR